MTLTPRATRVYGSPSPCAHSCSAASPPRSRCCSPVPRPGAALPAARPAPLPRLAGHLGGPAAGGEPRPDLAYSGGSVVAFDDGDTRHHPRRNGGAERGREDPGADRRREGGLHLRQQRPSDFALVAGRTRRCSSCRPWRPAPGRPAVPAAGSRSTPSPPPTRSRRLHLQRRRHARAWVGYQEGRNHIARLAGRPVGRHAVGGQVNLGAGTPAASPTTRPRPALHHRQGARPGRADQVDRRGRRVQGLRRRRGRAGREPGGLPRVSGFDLKPAAARGRAERAQALEPGVACTSAATREPAAGLRVGPGLRRRRGQLHRGPSLDRHRRPAAGAGAPGERPRAPRPAVDRRLRNRVTAGSVLVIPRAGGRTWWR